MTGLIYVVIIALWAAVLIPIWLRRHDQISEVRSTARFSSAMRSLGKNNRTDSGGHSSGSRDVRASNLAFDPRTRAQETAAKRRAIIMGVLSSALALTLVLAIVNVVPRWAPILLAVVVLSYVIAASVTSSQRSSSAGSSRRRERFVETYDDVQADYDELDDYRDVAYSDQVAEVAYPRTRGLRPPSKRSRDAQIAAAMDDFVSWDPWEGEEQETEVGWTAVPTTLPTYVSAPRATRVRRPIERDRDWSGEAMVEAARTMRRPRITVDDLADDSYALGSPAHTAADDTAELPRVRMHDGVNDGYEETRRAAGE